MSNSYDPDHAQLFAGPDLDPDCSQKLSADDTSRKRVKTLFMGMMRNDIGVGVIAGIIIK